MVKFLSLVALLLAAGCMSVPQATGTRSVQDDKVFLNGSLFAELRYLGTTTSTDGRTSQRGLAIFYPARREEVWIFPEHGWGIVDGGKDHYALREIEDEWQARGFGGLTFNNKKVDKNAVVFAWCYDVRISEDGGYIYYKTKGWLFESSHKYIIK